MGKMEQKEKGRSVKRESLMKFWKRVEVDGCCNGRTNLISIE